MAERIIAYGTEIDKLRDEMLGLFEQFMEEERRLRARGVLNAHVHFKTDRPNTMYLLEPLRDGNRKYTHVGVDPNAQAEARAKVRRWEQLVKLLRARGRLERRMMDLMSELQAQHKAFTYLVYDGKKALSEFRND